MTLSVWQSCTRSSHLYRMETYSIILCSVNAPTTTINAPTTTPVRQPVPKPEFIKTPLTSGSLKIHTLRFHSFKGLWNSWTGADYEWKKQNKKQRITNKTDSNPEDYTKTNLHNSCCCLFALLNCLYQFKALRNVDEKLCISEKQRKTRGNTDWKYRLWLETFELYWTVSEWH